MQYLIAPHVTLLSAVSNAGGYHSTKNFFANPSSVPSISAMADIALQAVTLAERSDTDKARVNHRIQGPSSSDLTERIFRPSGDEEESWVSYANCYSQIDSHLHFICLHTSVAAHQTPAALLAKKSLLRRKIVTQSPMLMQSFLMLSTTFGSLLCHLLHTMLSIFIAPHRI